MQNLQYPAILKIIPLGGVDNVTKNMFVYEYGSEIMLVDCGVGFPDEPSGKDEEQLLIPDFSYLLPRKDKIKGLVITHAHFDHFGAVPYLLEKMRMPIYSSRLTQEYIKNKLNESGIKPNSIDWRLIDEKENNISIGGSFRLTPFHVNHSRAAGLRFVY